MIMYIIYNVSGIYYVHVSDMFINAHIYKCELKERYWKQKGNMNQDEMHI